MSFPNLQPLVDELVYVNYAANRDCSPDVTPERWKKVYGPSVDEMEARYQAEKAITKAKLAECPCPECHLPTPGDELHFNGGLCIPCRMARDEHYREAGRG